MKKPINHITWSGVADKNAVEKPFGNGMRLVNFNLKQVTVNKKGEEKTAYMAVSVFGDAVGEALRVKSGSEVVVSGSLGSYSYDGKDGTKKFGTSITANFVGILEPAGGYMNVGNVGSSGVRAPLYNQDEIDEIPF